MRIIKSIIDTEVYSYLRGKLELGYQSHAHFSPEFEKVLGIMILISGSKKLPHEMDQNIEDCIKRVVDLIKNMTNESFSDIKKNIIGDLPNKEDSDVIWNQINKKSYEFQNKNLVEEINKIELKQFIESFEKCFKESGKFSIQVYNVDPQKWKNEILKNNFLNIEPIMVEDYNEMAGKLPKFFDNDK